MALSDLWADNLVNLFLATPGAPAGLPDDAPAAVPGAARAGRHGRCGPGGRGRLCRAGDVLRRRVLADSTGGAGESLLAADVSFGTPSADWGPIVGCAFTDAAGVLVTLGEEFDTPYDVTVGVPFVLPASAVSFAAATADSPCPTFRRCSRCHLRPCRLGERSTRRRTADLVFRHRHVRHPVEQGVHRVADRHSASAATTSRRRSSEPLLRDLRRHLRRGAHKRRRSANFQMIAARPTAPHRTTGTVLPLGATGSLHFTWTNGGGNTADSGTTT
jgi:hypothetical protein